MKKTFSLFLAVLLLAALLTGCAKQPEGNALYQDTPTVPQTNKRLTVFCIGDTHGPSLIRTALDLYQEQYPDVEVELVEPLELDAEEDNTEAVEKAYKKLSSQLKAGKGPDILLVNDRCMDIEKLVRQGLFADMEPFFAADDFDWEPYSQGVMNAGVWNGKRFLIPLSYDFPLLLTTKAALEETGFHVDACMDYQGFLDETARYLEDPAQTRLLFSDAWVLDYVNFAMLDYSGVPVVDYDNQTVDLSLPIFRATAQWYKSILDTHPQEPNLSELGGVAAVQDGEALWTNSVFGAYEDLYAAAGVLRTEGEVVMMPIRDADGGIQAEIQDSVAVGAGSENLENAYNFLKLLLSPTVQYTADSGLSVLHEANERLLSREEGISGTERSGSAVNAPSQEEIRQFLGLTEEITGGYYHNKLWLCVNMWPYLHDNRDYEETLRAAQSKLKTYITG